MKTVRRPPYPKWNPGYFPCSSLISLPLSSRRPSVSFGGFGVSVGVTVGYGVLAGELQEVPGDLGAPGLGAEREGRVGADQDGRGVN